MPLSLGADHSYSGVETAVVGEPGDRGVGRGCGGTKNASLSRKLPGDCSGPDKVASALGSHHHPAHRGLECSFPHTRKGQEIVEWRFPPPLLCVSEDESFSFLPFLVPPFLCQPDLGRLAVGPVCLGLCFSLVSPCSSAS